MKDAKGKVLYIGKAKDLKKRVSSYWSKAALDRYQIAFLLKKVANVEAIVTATEQEALLLENSLIKKHLPKYNIQLRDDKSYPSIKLSIKDQFPRIYVTRQIKKDGNYYFGPYSSALTCRQVADMIDKYFLLRTCSDHELKSRTRPCIQYQIKRCSAPCVDKISIEDYQRLVQQAELFLKGKNNDLKKQLTEKMLAASEALEFEEAARIHDLLNDIDQLLEKQQVASHHEEERDCLGFYREAERGMIAVLMIRHGTISGSLTYPFDHLGDDESILSSFITQFYSSGRYIPQEIFVPLPLDDQQVLMNHLATLKQKKVYLINPQRGDKNRLLGLAIQNAKAAFITKRNEKEDTEKILEFLQEKLKLTRLPRTMECYDISNTQGKQPVGSMVRFCEGKPDKKFYKRFKIKNLPDEPNDYAMMKEVLFRRLKHTSKRAGPACAPEGIPSESSQGTSLKNASVPSRGSFGPPASNNTWELPDLIVIDGGKGQLGIAQEVLKELDILGVNLCSLAKPQEGEDCDKVFRPGRKNPILLPKNSSALHWLQALRDEAHRFAITYHKKLRNKTVTRSVLDDIPGIGAARKKELLKYFGSLKRLKKASLEDLRDVPGLNQQTAQKLYDSFHK